METKPEGTQTTTKPKGTKGGNGNGGVTVKGVRFTKRTEGEGNWFDLLLIAAYFCQSRGQASVTDIHEDITVRLNSAVAVKTLADALEALRKQEILAIGQSAGDGINVYSMKRFKFNCSPEIAQGPQGVIHELRADSTGELIIERFSKDTGKKAAPRPDEPVDCKVTFVLTREFIGGQVWDGNDLLQENYFDATMWHTLHLDRKARMDGKKLDTTKTLVMLPRFVGDSPGMFERTGAGELLVAHAHAVQNFFKKGVEAYSPSELAKRGYQVLDFMGFTDIVAMPTEKQLTFKRCPIQRDEKGPQSKAAGLKNYECLKAGTELTLEFSFPTKNYITPVELKTWLTRVLRLCLRSMSPARGDQCGTNSKLQKMEIRPWKDWDGGWVEV